MLISIAVTSTFALIMSDLFAPQTPGQPGGYLVAIDQNDPFRASPSRSSSVRWVLRFDSFNEYDLSTWQFPWLSRNNSEDHRYELVNTPEPSQDHPSAYMGEDPDYSSKDVSMDRKPILDSNEERRASNEGSDQEAGPESGGDPNLVSTLLFRKSSTCIY